jgi:hypothetical protein
MAITSAAGLLAALRAHPLLDEPRLTELAGNSATGDDDAAALGRELVRRGWLTRYQVERLLAGQGDELVLGAYLLLEPLGAGGMGRVYKARHRVMDRLVAVKLIRPDLLGSPQAVSRFRREIRLAARLSHPNVILAHDAEEVGGRLDGLVGVWDLGGGSSDLLAGRAPAHLVPRILGGRNEKGNLVPSSETVNESHFSRCEQATRRFVRRCHRAVKYVVEVIPSTGGDLPPKGVTIRVYVLNDQLKQLALLFSNDIIDLG